MDATQLLVHAGRKGADLRRGKVSVVQADDVVVECDAGSQDRVACELLHTSELSPLCLVVGDTVLICVLDPEARQGVVLGRIGQTSDHCRDKTLSAENLTIAASRQLTLRCGEGTIGLRSDGKLSIKGKDLVSHAKRTNRVKGGSVAIN